VGDRGRRRVQPRDAGRVRLDLAQLVALDPAQAGDAVRGRAPLELAQAVELRRVERDDELAARLQRDRALLAVGAEQLHAAPAERRLQRPRRVVDAGVDDAAVAARLVARDRVLLLEDSDGRVRAQLAQPPRDGQPDDPGPDDADPHRAHLDMEAEPVDGAAKTATSTVADT